MNRQVNELLRLREYYKMDEEEFSQLIQCTGVINFNESCRLWSEVSEYKSIANDLAEAMRPYQIMYNLVMCRLQGLLDKEIEKIYGN